MPEDAALVRVGLTTEAGTKMRLFAGEREQRSWLPHRLTRANGRLDASGIYCPNAGYRVSSERV
jgi:hypothetical protein